MPIWGIIIIAAVIGVILVVILTMKRRMKKKWFIPGYIIVVIGGIGLYTSFSVGVVTVGFIIGLPLVIVGGFLVKRGLVKTPT